MSASECQCCSDWAVLGSISCAYGVVMRRLLRMQLFCHRWRRGNQQCTVCRWCTTGVRGGRCLSQFQICVCVSGLVLSVSKFSLCQSASAVTKSLRSPVGASCQSVKKTRMAVCWYIEQPRDSCSAPALRHNRDFNFATAQRPREAMQVFILINKICSRDTGLCSRRKCVGY